MRRRGPASVGTDALLREFVRSSLDAIDPPPVHRSERASLRRSKPQPFAGLLLPESYVRDVLGIDRGRLLKEGFDVGSVSDLIIREHVLFEGWWDKAKEFVKDIAKDNPITNAAEAVKAAGSGIKGVVAALTSVTTSGGDAIGTVVAGAQNLMSKNLQGIRKGVTGLVARVKALAGKIKIDRLKDIATSAAEVLAKMVDRLVEMIKKATSGGGWKGMLATVACYLASSAARGKIGTFIDAALKVLSGDPKAMVDGAMKIKAMVDGAVEAVGGEDEDPELEPGAVDKEIAAAEAAGQEGESAADDGAYAKAIAILAGAVKGFAWRLVKKVVGSAGVAAVEQLAGPVGFVKKLAEITGKVAGGIDWVCQEILAAVERATFKPVGSGGRT